MNTNTVGVGAAALLIGLVGGYMLWGNTPASPGAHMMQDGTMMSQNIDQHFIAQMIPHHEGAIAMAQVALERSKEPKIITLANNIIKAQEKEITDMRGWYEAWYGEAVPATGGMGMRMGGMEGDIATLESISLASFDKEFLKQMIPHHEMALMMVQMLSAGTQRPEMKQLAQNIQTSQSSEIEMMRSWLNNGFGN